jgi:hypothetical protein
MQNAECRVIEPNGKITKKGLRTDNVQNQLNDLYNLVANTCSTIEIVNIPQTNEPSECKPNPTAQRYIFEQTGRVIPLVGNVVIVDSKFIM